MLERQDQIRTRENRRSSCETVLDRSFQGKNVAADARQSEWRNSTAMKSRRERKADAE